MYEIKDNVVLRDGEQVAVLEDNKVKEYTGDGKRYRLPISKFLKKLGAPVEPVKKKVSSGVKTWDLPINEAFPDAPKSDPMLGDKAPDLVRWIWENHREDYEHRYAGRKTIIDAEKPKKEPDTAKAVRAQHAGFMDANDRKGCRPGFHGFYGVFEREYKVGYKNGGGIINE